MKNYLNKTFIILVFISLFTLLTQNNINSANAQTSNSSSATTIIPPDISPFANPGESIQEQIQIRNESSQDILYNISTQDFEAQGINGQVQLVQGDKGNTFSLSQWIELNTTSIDIAAHAEKIIKYSINVPTNAEPGGHYGAVLIQSQAGNTPGQANVSSGQVSLILLRVSGNIKEKSSVVSFTAPSYSEYGPVPLSLLVKNEGDVHVMPHGTIIITDMFKNKVAEIPFNGANVLPTAERIMTTLWDDKNPVGKYTATLIATYGENPNGNVLTATTTFTVFPKPLAIGIGIAAGALILIIIFLIAGRKRIAKALKVIAKG